MPPRWTHITINCRDIDASVEFYTSFCGLSIVRDRRIEQVVPLVAPQELLDELPQSDEHIRAVLTGRAEATTARRVANACAWRPATNNFGSRAAGTRTVTVRKQNQF